MQIVTLGVGYLLVCMSFLMGALFRLESSAVRVFAGLTALAIAFQYGHFLEHIVQVLAWISGYTHAPYMTDVGYSLAHYLGQTFFSFDSPERIHRLGMELLHLFGNAIFFVGILGLWVFMPARMVQTALIIQTLHLFEHVSLTLSLIMFDSAIGLSTLFGMPLSEFTSVAYRVWLHFLLNAIPTTLVTYALVIQLRQHIQFPSTSPRVRLPLDTVEKLHFLRG